MTLESQILNLNARQILIKRLSTAQALSYTGPLGELVLDTTLKLLRIQDGVTPGGILVTSADYLANQVANVQSQLNFIKSNIDPAALDSLTEIVANVNALLSNNVESQLFNSGNYANLMPNGDLVISGDLLPKTHLLQDLGSPTQAWANLYVGASTIYFGTVPVSVTSSGLQVGSGSNKLPVYGNVRFEDGTLQTTAYNPAYLAQLQYLVTPPVANNLVTIYNTIDKGLISNVAVLQANVNILEEQVHIVNPLGIQKTVTTDVNGSSLGGATNANRTTIAFSSYQERNAAINIVANASTTNTEINSQVILLGTVTGTIEVGQAVYKMTPTPTLIGEVGTQLTASAYNLDVLGLDPNVAIAPGTRLEFYRSGFVEYGTKAPMQIIWANGNVTLITSTSTNNPFGSQLTLHTAENQTLLPYPIIVETMIYEPSYKEHVFNSGQRITSRYGNLNVYGGTTDINLITNNKRLSLLRTGNLVIPGSIYYPDGTIQSTAIPDRLISNNAQLVLNASGSEPYVSFPAATNGSQLQISESELASVAGNLALTSAEDTYIISNGSGAAPGGSKNWKFDRGGNLTLPNNAVLKDTATNSISFGLRAGDSGQGNLTVAIGSQAGEIGQGLQSTAVGSGAGNYNQGIGTVAIGTNAGAFNQGLRAVAIGGLAGAQNQGEYAVALGNFAGGTNQPNNSIVINASGTALNGSASGLFIDPIREDTGNIAKVVYYNISTKELTYADLGAAATVDITDTNGLTTTYYPTFVENRTSGQTIRADVDLTYRSDDNLLRSGNIQVGRNIYGSPLGGISNAIQLRPNIDIDKRFLFTVDSSSGNYIRSGMEMPMAEVDKSVTLGFPHNNGHVGYIYSQGSDANSTEFNNAFNIMSNGVDLKLSAFNSNDKYVWTFDVKGNITLPQTNMNTSPAPVSLPGITWTDGTFQTTAYTGAAATVDILNTNNLSNTFYPTFVEFRTTGQYVRADVDFTYRSDSNTLTVPKIAGMLQGNVDHLGGYINFTGSPAPGTSGITFADGTTQTTAWTRSAAQVQSSPPGSPVTGQLYYDTDDGKTYIWTGSAWVDASPSGSAAPTWQEVTLTGGSGAGALYLTSSSPEYTYVITSNESRNIRLPSSVGLVLGRRFVVRNSGNAGLPIQTSTGTAFNLTIYQNQTVTAIAANVTVDGTASWMLEITGSALTGVGSQVMAFSPTITTPTMSGATKLAGVHEKFSSFASVSGVVSLDASTSQIFYIITPGSNWTPNLLNLNLTSTYATAVTFVISQGATAYYPDALQIGGVAQTINWQGNQTPTPTANRVDTVTFSIFNNSGTYTVLGQMTGF